MHTLASFSPRPARPLHYTPARAMKKRAAAPRALNAAIETMEGKRMWKKRKTHACAPPAASGHSACVVCARGQASRRAGSESGFRVGPGACAWHARVHSSPALACAPLSRFLLRREFWPGVGFCCFEFPARPCALYQFCTSAVSSNTHLPMPRPRPRSAAPAAADTLTTTHSQPQSANPAGPACPALGWGASAEMLAYGEHGGQRGG